MHDEHDHMENVSLHMISVGFVWLPSITLYNVDMLGLIMVEERTVKLEIFSRRISLPFTPCSDMQNI